MADFQPGALLAGRFEVVGTLGRGGMATVYLVEDRVREERVALKVLHGHLADDPSMRRRLRREVAAAGLVRSPAALVAHELHELDGTLGLSMPFHGGTTLTERVRARGPLSSDEVRALGVRIAEALADAHRHGVLHRDVTPNNAMLDEGGDAVLTDFGLARTQEATATATSVMGTPGYAAPEVYQGQRTDPRSDLYSLGALLYFAATGRSPHGTGAPAAVLHAQLTADPEPIEVLAPGLAPDLARTIDALLARAPEQRPPSASEVALALAAGRAALVPEVPDTWDPAEEPVLPDSGPLLPSPLPTGDFEVEVRGRRGCDARTLADQVGRVVGLPDGSLEVTRAMRTRKRRFVLTRATDRQTADRLAEAARVAGYRAKVVDRSPRTLFEALMGAAPMLIPLMWIALPLWTIHALGPQLSLVVTVGLSILIPALSAPLARRPSTADLPVALSGDLESHLVGARDKGEDIDDFIEQLGLPSFLRDLAHELAADDDVRDFAERMRRGIQAQTVPAGAVVRPTAKPTAKASAKASAREAGRPPEKRVSRAEDLRGRALGNLDLLVAAVAAADSLPELARDDLRRTAASLRERAVELAKTAMAVEAALGATPEPADVSWIQGRLMRLETLERAGEPVDRSERSRLEAALQSADAAAAARDELESRLTATLAQLLEIGAVATRARAELVGGADVPSTARDLTEQLDRQVRAVDATRRELAQRKRASEPAFEGQRR